MSRVLVFGIGRIAELAHLYLTEDSPHDVVGFTVDETFMKGDNFHGLPVVAFENVHEQYAPSDYAMLLPISFKRMNHIRADRLSVARNKGYEIVSYVSSRATTFSDFHCGENCFILEDNTIQPFVDIGEDVIMWSGNHIGHHSVIGDHVMITSHVVISGGCTIEPYCFFGVNATVRDETVVARESLVGAGTTIMADTEPFSIYRNKGTPATGLRSDKLSRISHKSAD